MPFESVDFIHAFSKKRAQQDEQSFHRWAPTNHDVIVKDDGDIYVAVSLKKINVTLRHKYNNKQKKAFTWGNLEND